MAQAKAVQLSAGREARLDEAQLAANEVALSFEIAATNLWRSQAVCVHGTATTLTHVAPGVLDCVAWVSNIMRHHQLVVGCGCQQSPPTLNATVTYAPASGIVPGERRIIIEQSAVIPVNARKNFLYFGRLTCAVTGSFYIDARLELSNTVASGARGVGQVFVAGTPAVITAPVVDVAGKATATLRGTMNMYPNQPLAFAFTNTGTTNQNVSMATLTVSEIWVPS